MIEVKESDFRNLYLNTKKIDPKIQANLRKNLKKAAKEVIPKAQRAVLSIPSDHRSDIHARKPVGMGLRASIAASMKVAVKAAKKKSGVFIRVDRKMFVALSQRSGKKPEKLPKYVDGVIKRWKHPVFGHEMDKPEKWPTQPSHPFFLKTIKENKPIFLREVEKAMQQAFEELDKKNI